MEESEPEKMTCRGCISNKYCRKHSVTKGSATCEQERGLIPRKEKKKEPSKTAQSMGLLSHFMRTREGK